MEIKILKEYEAVKNFLEIVRRNADKYGKEFGFLPESAYLHSAYQGQLWIAISSENQEYQGHLMWGGKYPSLKVFQVFTAKSSRGKGAASKLINELILYGEKDSFSSISARVAADLKANKFYDKMGFNMVQQVDGDGKNRRKINIRVRVLKTPTLFSDSEIIKKMHKGDNLKYYDSTPILANPVYVIDLNVLLDLIKDNPNAGVIKQIIGYSLTGNFRLFVTKEFSKELERHSYDKKNDPTLSFAKTLPTLPKIDDEVLNNIIPFLQNSIFSEKTRDKLKINDLSDLNHIATCIHHGVTGFITSDKAILRASDTIRDIHNLEILSPGNFVSSSVPDFTSFSKIEATTHDTYTLKICELEEKERHKVEKFLREGGLSNDLLNKALEPGNQNSLRVRICIEVDNKIIGFASWNPVDSSIQKNDLYIFITEDHPSALKAIDHILAKVSYDSLSNKLFRIDLKTGPNNNQIRKTAIERGFRATTDIDNSTVPGRLSKISYNGILTKDNWYNFTLDFKNLTGLILQNEMPTFDEFAHTGVIINSEDKRIQRRIDLFEFETLLSPITILCPGRKSVIIPIKEKYAAQLLNNVSIQRSLFPESEAFLCVEKAYFRNPRNANLFQKGMPIAFYVSGIKSIKSALGKARITSTALLTIDQIQIKLSRQGVLSEKELKQVADVNGRVHAITFDNASLFPNKISFQQLKREKLVSDANLVTAQELTFPKTEKLFSLAFNGGRK